MKHDNQWFASWFDTPYYHILYKNRDYTEARLFLDNLLVEMDWPPDTHLLDLACGKGRHAIYLASKGFQVTGIDLSEQSIGHARQFETDRLSFYAHDMRLPFKQNFFGGIINVFTSFGYFDNEQDHLDTLRHVANGLVDDGHFVLDFFNAHKVIARLQPEEQKTVDGITFKLTRRVEEGYIIKQIHFSDRGKDYQYQERVRAFTFDDFELLFQQSGLSIDRCFGDYQLQPFDPLQSDRLILIAKKKKPM